ncbi:MAG: hypothetical protein WA130_01095, partial [Candidatus Methanoperedens sp.]
GGNTIICSHTQSYGLGQGMILKDGWIDLLVEFRKLLIKQSTRWEKKLDNYLALLHFACAWITLRASRLFG